MAHVNVMLLTRPKEGPTVPVSLYNDVHVLEFLESSCKFFVNLTKRRIMFKHGSKLIQHMQGYFACGRDHLKWNSCGLHPRYPL